MICTCGIPIYGKFPYYCPCGTRWASEDFSQTVAHTVKAKIQYPTESPSVMWGLLHSKRLEGDMELWFANWNKQASKTVSGCGCSTGWREYIADNPPDFSSDENWFTWGWRAHDYVSANKSNRPRYSFRDAVAMYRPEFYQPTNDLLIISVAVGRDMAELHQITRKSHERYAKSIGADYVALGNKTQDWWGLEKFRIEPFARKYKRCLFLDADVWVKKDVPSIFDEVPIGCIGMHNDWPYLAKNDWIYTGIWQEKADICDALGIPLPNALNCLNSGVVVFDGADADLWAMPESIPTKYHCSEQHVVDCRVPLHRWVNLDSKWNTQFWWSLFGVGGYYEQAPDAHFVHLAGCTNRMLEIQKWTES